MMLMLDKNAKEKKNRYILKVILNHGLAIMINID